jgi:hypothetical protein
MSAIQNTEGQVPQKIVELLISNINELAKQVQIMPSQVATDISADIERLTVATTTVVSKLSTPPRNEELSEKLDITIERIDTDVIRNGLDEIKKTLRDDLMNQLIREELINKLIKTELIGKVKWMTRSVWLVTGFLAVAMLIASIIVMINNKDIVADIKKEIVIAEKLPKTIDDRFKEVEKLLKEHMVDYQKDRIPDSIKK